MGQNISPTPPSPNSVLLGFEKVGHALLQMADKSERWKVQARWTICGQCQICLENLEEKDLRGKAKMWHRTMLELDNLYMSSLYKMHFLNFWSTTLASFWLSAAFGRLSLDELRPNMVFARKCFQPNNRCSTKHPFKCLDMATLWSQFWPLGYLILVGIWEISRTFSVWALTKLD